MREVVIVSAVRTPVGKFQGALSDLSAVALGSLAIRAALDRTGAELQAHVDECIIGCVLQAGLGQAPARFAALGAGIADTVSALTVNMVCGSGLRAVALGAQSIAAGDAEIVVAGGMESMSNVPYLLPGARKGYRLGDQKVVDALVNDGLWCPAENWHMGMSAEAVAEKHGFTREQQDAFAVESHRRAAEARDAGRFDAEIVPVTVPSKKGAITVTHDESIREDATLTSLGALKPAFKKDGGTVTAGNAPGLNDAAAALLLMSADKAHELKLPPMATIRAQATSGVAPKWIMLAPVTGVQKLLAKAGWTMEDVDLFELNEAFAVQAMGVSKELGLDMSKVNVNGGAVAIGHPIGASGARILVTLLHEMQRRDAKRGVAALCLGGGNSVALAVERPLSTR
jgi:acetyl-CoA C-acetyltransferase